MIDTLKVIALIKQTGIEFVVVAAMLYFLWKIIRWMLTKATEALDKIVDRLEKLLEAMKLHEAQSNQRGQLIKREHDEMIQTLRGSNHGQSG